VEVVATFTYLDSSGGDPGGVLVSGHDQDLSKRVSRNGGTPQDLATLIVKAWVWFPIRLPQ